MSQVEFNPNNTKDSNIEAYFYIIQVEFNFKIITLKINLLKSDGVYNNVAVNYSLS